MVHLCLQDEVNTCTWLGRGGLYKSLHAKIQSKFEFAFSQAQEFKSQCLHLACPLLLQQWRLIPETLYKLKGHFQIIIWKSTDGVKTVMHQTVPLNLAVPSLNSIFGERGSGDHRRLDGGRKLEGTSLPALVYKNNKLQFEQTKTGRKLTIPRLLGKAATYVKLRNDGPTVLVQEVSGRGHLHRSPGSAGEYLKNGHNKQHMCLQAQEHARSRVALVHSCTCRPAELCNLHQEFIRDDEGAHANLSRLRLSGPCILALHQLRSFERVYILVTYYCIKTRVALMISAGT